MELRELKDKLKTIDPNEVVVPEYRQRQQFDRKAHLEMVASIKHVGQIQPGVCHLVDGKVQLIAGERRLRACKALSIPYLYILKEDIRDELHLKEIELEENIRRKDLDWKEDVLAKLDLHETKQEIYGRAQVGARGGHTMQDTADHLHVSKGLVSQDIELAMWLKEVPEVGKARNKTEAKKIIQRIKETLARRKALKESFVKEESPSPYLKGQAAEPVQEIDDKELMQKRLLDYDRRCKIGKLEEEIERLEGTFDLVLFDPPWGVEYDEVGFIGGEKRKYEDSLEQYIKSLPGWLELLYERMSENSHLYLFFGIVNHEFVFNTLEAKGFSTNRMPIIWHKAGGHGVRNPKVWPGRCYEPIAYARKGSKDLLKPGAPDVISTRALTPKMKVDHPSAKHPDVYLELLERSGYPGDRILDPMSGSGMSAVACEHLKPKKNFDWWTIEKEKDFRNLGIFNLMRGYRLITAVDKKKEKKEEPKVEAHAKYDKWGGDLKEERDKKMEGKSFRELQPGSPEWKEYWKAHPEEQDAMLAFRKELKGG